MDFVQKETYTMEDLLAVMERLRAPDGCPWDREQTHRSIRQCFLEETYTQEELERFLEYVLDRVKEGAYDAAFDHVQRELTHG